MGLGDVNALRRNEVLLRRAKIRRLLAERSGAEGISSMEELAELVEVSKFTINEDLKELGAVKLAERIDGRHVEWWHIPAHNPNLPDHRSELPEGVVEQEVALKLKAHVLDIVPLGAQLAVLTERSAGPLVADWLSLLCWPEILYVHEARNSCLLACADAEDADWVRRRLLGRGGAR